MVLVLDRALSVGLLVGAFVVVDPGIVGRGHVVHEGEKRFHRRVIPAGSDRARCLGFFRVRTRLEALEMITFIE